MANPEEYVKGFLHTQKARPKGPIDPRKIPSLGGGKFANIGK
jgi:hypothetical protein